MNYDVIVVGGGPAGSTAAFCLQRARKRCLIVEQKTSIGEKTCGGLLTWSGIQALEAAGLPSRELLHMGAVPIHQFVYFQNHETTSHCYHGGEYGLGLTRRLLDQWLLDYALAAGAVLKAGTRFRAVVRRRDGFFQVGEDSAPRLIIATGASGLIPHNAGPLLKKQTFGLSAQITGKTALAPDAVFFYMLGENGPDYFWIIPNGTGLWNIGIWFQHPPTDATAQFWRYKARFVDGSFDEISFVRPLRGAFCGNMDLSGAFPQNCHAIGDAAGLNQATTGEGLRYAIASAVTLASQIAKQEEG